MFILNDFRKNNKLTNFSSMKFPSIIFLVLLNTLSAQKLELKSEFGEFSLASSFDIDLNGNFYICDLEENTITKIDKHGNTIISIGGYGWEESAFDEPIDIASTTLSLYVTDKNNNRIQRFDKDLNFLSSFSGNSVNSDVEFAYPSCIKISKIGDMFILDSDNNRILKFSLSGEFLMEIGSNDAGKFALSNPKYFTIDSNGNLYVLDENKIKILDQYGNATLSYSIPYSPEKIRIVNSKILYIENSSIIGFDLKERKEIFNFQVFDNLDSDLIVDALLLNDVLHVLTKSKILSYYIKSK